jgi:hypothetical protein
MKTITTIAAFAASAAVLAPAAVGGGTPLPPIDAGSNQPNPIYTHKIPPIDAGSDEINPAYYFDPATNTVRRVRPTAPTAAVSAQHGGFAWTWTGIGLGIAFAIASGATLTLLLRRRTVRVSQA